MTNLKYSFIVIIYYILSSFPGISQSNKPGSLTEIGAGFGLSFEKQIEYRSPDSAFTENIQLLNLKKKAQAIQFRLLFNKEADDEAFLIFNEIQKGSDISDPGWLLDYNVIKGSVSERGGFQDVVFVVLYNINQNGGLIPGDYNNLFKIKYTVPGISGLKKDIKSSIKISNAEASTFDGFAIDIKPGNDELKIIIKAKN